MKTCSLFWATSLAWMILSLVVNATEAAGADSGGNALPGDEEAVAQAEVELKSISALAKTLSDLKGAGKTSLRFGEITARGPNAAKWEGNLAPIKADLKQELGKYPQLDISDMENLKSIEENAALDGRNVRLQAADYEVKIIARQIESSLVLEIRSVRISNGLERTFLLQLDPRSVGIDPEAEIPPTDAAVKVSDKTMMDIAEKVARNLHLQSLVEAEAREDEADEAFARSIAKNIQSNDEQIQRFAKQIVEEISELMRLDHGIGRQSFDDRHDFLLIEGKLQGIDTSRQRSLLREVAKIWEKACDTGIKPNPAAVIDACVTVVKSANGGGSNP
jgi:hypothetical protein